VPDPITGAVAVELKLELSDASAAPTFLSHAQAVQTDSGLSTLCFYEVSMAPALTQDAIALQAAGGPIPTRCTAKVVMTAERLKTFAALLQNHITQLSSPGR